VHMLGILKSVVRENCFRLMGGVHIGGGGGGAEDNFKPNPSILNLKNAS
jgi:hypothetical protein